MTMLQKQLRAELKAKNTNRLHSTHRSSPKHIIINGVSYPRWEVRKRRKASVTHLVDKSLASNYLIGKDKTIVCGQSDNPFRKHTFDIQKVSCKRCINQG